MTDRGLLRSTAEGVKAPRDAAPHASGTRPIKYHRCGTELFWVVRGEDGGLDGRPEKEERAWSGD